MSRWRVRIRRSSFLIGLLVGVALLWSIEHLAQLNWRSIHAPVDQEPLVIRHDAKGDGHFGAPRSGNLSHHGVDLEAPLGSPVRAIRSGRVITTARHRGRGLYVELDHGRGLRSLYAHLHTIDVTRGQRVAQGQSIGTVGKTGNARHHAITPHLHLEISRHGTVIDPASLGLMFVDRQEESSDAIGGN
ncbi:MAG: M23 family metallopeptidase [Candidatus Omnitrophica bacterium]|nr:M23 family metallopeptidase [Candidatus Omnitrophota bacterium]